MKHLGLLAMFMLLGSFATGNLKGQQESGKVGSGIVKGKVFRSDTNEAIPNSYILITREKGSPSQVEHFDLRTDDNGDYRFQNVPAGKYTVSIYAWFPKKNDVPCRNFSEAKTVDDGKVIVEWQHKSDAFMEIVTIRGFSVESNQEKVKDFDLLCK